MYSRAQRAGGGVELPSVGRTNANDSSVLQDGVHTYKPLSLSAAGSFSLSLLCVRARSRSIPIHSVARSREAILYLAPRANVHLVLLASVGLVARCLLKICVCVRRAVSSVSWRR